MPLNSSNHLDPINVSIALASILFGPTLASIVGPYAVILMAATLGAAWALGRRPPDAKIGATLYFLRLNVTAVLVTVSLANLTSQWAGMEDGSWLLAPIALFVGSVGDDWPKVSKWLMLRLARLIERRTGGNE